MENKNVYFKEVRFIKDEKDGISKWTDGNGHTYHEDKLDWKYADMGYIRIGVLDSANFSVIEGCDSMRKLYDTHEDTRNHINWFKEGSTIYLEVEVIDKVQFFKLGYLLKEKVKFLGFDLKTIHLSPKSIVNDYKNKILKFVSEL